MIGRPLRGRPSGSRARRGVGALARLLEGLGIGVAAACVAAFCAVVLLFAPLMVWLSWNVLALGDAVGLSDLSLVGVLLLTAFLVSGFAGRLVIAGAVFVIDPAWFGRSAYVTWPQPTLRHFLAVLLLLWVAAPSHMGESRDGRTG